MTSYNIAVVPGDGIGKEVVDAGFAVLKAASDMFDFGFDATWFPHGTDHYLQNGILMPDEDIAKFRGYDAILLGAIGDPRVEVGLVERAVIAGLRFKLDLWVNLRPIKLFHEDLCPLKNKTPADVDFTVCRENTEGHYAMITGVFKKDTVDELTTQLEVNTHKGVERIIRYGFETARKRNKKKKLMLVDKANAVRAQDIYTRLFEKISKEYPDIATEHAYVDAACMWMVQRPEDFDTVVTPNLFGDIITDLGAAIQGGLGVAASGNINPGHVSMFEPIHGSAPKYKGKNVASPVATVAAVQMMLDYLGQGKAAACIGDSIENALLSKRIPDLSARSGVSTSKQGEILVDELKHAVDSL